MIGGIPQSTIVAELSGTCTNVVTSSIFENFTVPRTYHLHIKSGAIVFALTTNPALTLSAVPNGSTMIVSNDGSIYGKGGAGGDAGTGVCATASAGNGQSGRSGNVALSMSCDVIIDNINGAIFGGGGGGGGGGIAIYPGSSIGAGGGGGGGGQSYTLGSALGGGIGALACSNPHYGSSGDASTVAGPGNGGSGTSTAVLTFEVAGGNGGNGGAWGAAGNAGTEGTATAGSAYSSNGGSGGAAGKSIIKNGNTLTFMSGDGAANVKGAIGA